MLRLLQRLSSGRVPTVLAGVVVVTMLVSACGGAAATPTQAPAPTATVAAQPTTSAPTAVPTPKPTSTPVPAPTATTAPAPKRGGTFTMRLSGDFAFNWDTYNAGGQYAVIILQNILNNLTYLDPVNGSSARPDLATSWDLSQDGTTITYHLRKGVTWTDGTPFTSKDVVFSLNQARNPTVTADILHKSNLSGIKDITAPDDNTVVVTLTKPSASYFVTTSLPALLIYPASAGSIADWAKNPIGTGPFNYKSVAKLQNAIVVKNPNYFKSDAAGSKLPYLDEADFVEITDQSLAFSAFITGKLSCACGYSSDIIVSQKPQAVGNIPGVKFGSSWNTNLLALNTARAPFNNQAVRQAVNVGLDRITLAKVIHGGVSFPPTYFVPSELGGKLSIPTDQMVQLPGFRTPHSVDVTAANDLFKKAGVDPTTLNVQILGTTVQTDMSEALQAVLLTLGIKSSIQSVTNAVQVQQEMAGNFDMVFTGGGISYDDPKMMVAPWSQTGGSNNFAKISDPKIDQLLAQQDGTLDPVQRADVLKQLQLEELDFAAFVPMNTLSDVYAFPPYVMGIPYDRAFTVSNAHRLDTVWFNK